jgi:heme exporter protein A
VTSSQGQPRQPATTILEVVGLELWRGERCLATDLHLSLGTSEILLLKGSNGSGKTTLLRTLAGLRPTAEGQVHYRLGATQDADPGQAPETASPYIAYMGHRPPIKAGLTVGEHLDFALALTAHAATTTARALAESVGLSREFDRLGRELSAGQGRRLGLAIVLAKAAQIWLLDEPYAGLDGAGEALLDQSLKAHVDAGGSAVIAVHHTPVLSGIASREFTL